MEPYLGRFWQFLLGIFLQVDWVPRTVSSGERISRFIPYSGWIKRDKGAVSPAAFMPSPKTGDTSVYRTAGCTERRVWLLGVIFVERKRADRRKIIARADVCSDLVLREGLKVRPRVLPHPRHADLTNWPDEKARQKDKANALAQKAALSINANKEMING